MPLRFPGGDPRIGEATDARLIARAMEWAGTDDRAADEVFNIANGDVYQWEADLAAHRQLFDMELGPRHPMSLARTMPGNADLWPKITQKHDLIRYSSGGPCAKLELRRFHLSATANAQTRTT